MSDAKDLPPTQESIAEAKATWAKHLEAARAFYRTKLAIQRGVPLHKWSALDLQASGYLGPWKFNAIQTAITGGLASASVNIADALSTTNPAEPETLEGLDPGLASILETTWGWLAPFTIPICLTGFVYLMGWGSLHRRDSTSEKLRQARFTYLYLDGAYGLYSQFFLAFGMSFVSTDLGQKILGSYTQSFFSIAFLFALLACGTWQIIITGKKIPRLLFAANGYSGRVRRFWQRPQPTDPPWNKLVLAYLIGSGPLLLLTFLLIYTLSFSLAWLLYQVRGVLA